MVDEYLDLETARRDIVDVGSRMYGFRLIVGLEGNLSARVAEDRVLATPAARCKGSLRPEDLVLVDLDGRPLGDARPSTELAMHLTIYRRRPDVRAVVHGHPPHATAFAVAGRALDLCLLPEVVVSLGVIPVSRYATPSTAQVGESVGELIVDHDAVLLRNHGAVAVGTSVPDAYHKLETVEQLARITLYAGLLGGARPLTRSQVDELQSIRGVYGIEDAAPACRSLEDDASADVEKARLARIVAEEVVRALGDDLSHS